MKDLNLVPKDYILQKRRKRKILFYSIVGVLLAALIAVFVTIPLLTRHNLQYQFSILDKQLKETVNYAEIEKEFSQLQHIHMQREDEAKALMAMGINITCLNESIEKCMPERLFTTNLSINCTNMGATVVLRGVSASENEIASFISHLRKNSMFQSVELTMINRNVTSIITSETDGTNSINSEKDSQVKSYNFEINLNINSGK